MFIVSDRAWAQHNKGHNEELETVTVDGFVLLVRCIAYDGKKYTCQYEYEHYRSLFPQETIQKVFRLTDK